VYGSSANTGTIQVPTAPFRVSTCLKFSFKPKQSITNRSTESKWSWNFSRSPNRRMKKRHKSISVHQRRNNDHYRQRGASNSFEQHQVKTSHVESRYASNITTPKLKNSYIQSRKLDSRFSNQITEPKQSHHLSSSPHNKMKTNSNKQKWKKHSKNQIETNT